MKLEQPKLGKECFDGGIEFDLVSPNWNIVLQLAMMFVDDFAALTIGMCPNELNPENEFALFDFSPHGRRVIKKEISDRSRVLQSHLEAGNILGRNVKAGGWECDVKHAIQWAYEQGWELPEQMLSMLHNTEKKIFVEQPRTEVTDKELSTAANEITQAATAPAPAAQRNKLRRNTLDPAIDKAIEKAGNKKLADVYLALKALAIDSTSPFTGAVDGDALLYTNDNDDVVGFTKNALGKRLKIRR